MSVPGRTRTSTSRSAAASRTTKSSSRLREELVHGLEWELRRLPANANRRAWRALEIGCGPGRLMRPMSRHFGEIHGVDVSDEMIARARQNLRSVSRMRIRMRPAVRDLAAFADESFDLVYSYAVFQHIPSRDVVMQYLREAQARPEDRADCLRCQINGLDKTAKIYDTWSGVRISADEVREYALENDMQLLALGRCAHAVYVDDDAQAIARMARFARSKAGRESVG